MELNYYDKQYCKKYNKFQNDFGQNVEQDYDTFIESLFSPESTKTANGQVLVANRDELKGHLPLLEICQVVGQWILNMLLSLLLVKTTS